LRNTAARLKSKDLPPPKFVLATPLRLPFSIFVTDRYMKHAIVYHQGTAIESFSRTSITIFILALP